MRLYLSSDGRRFPVRSATCVVFRAARLAASDDARPAADQARPGSQPQRQRDQTDVPTATRHQANSVKPWRDT